MVDNLLEKGIEQPLTKNVSAMRVFGVGIKSNFLI